MTENRNIENTSELELPAEAESALENMSEQAEKTFSGLTAQREITPETDQPETVETAENKTAAEPVTAAPSGKTNGGKRKFGIVLVLSLCLALAICLLFLSMYAYKNREAIREAAKPTVVPTSDPDATPASTPLPDELLSKDSKTILIDKTHGLDSTYVPATLTDSVYLNSTGAKILLDEETAQKAREMKDTAAAEAGVTLVLSEGYISYDEQLALYEDRLTLANGVETDLANSFSKAGYSEHQTGLAIDFSDDPARNNMTEEFGNTAAGQWLYNNAYRFGFILRYPKNKLDITGYNYQPWHYRYVGVDVATAMYNERVNQGLADGEDFTFEEYYNLVNH